MKDIVIEIRGGVIVEIYCDDPKVRPVVINWDEAQSSNDTSCVGFLWASCPHLSELPDDTRAQFQHAITNEMGDEPRIVRT